MKTQARLLFALSCMLMVAAALAGCSRDTSPEDRELIRSPLLERLTRGAIYPGIVDPGAHACRGLRLGSWGRAEKRRDGGTHAWTTGVEAKLQLPIEHPGAGALVLRGYGLAGPGDARRLELIVNGSSLGEQDLPSVAGNTSWTLPANKLRRGLNDISLRVDRVVSPADLGRSDDVRTLGVLVDWLQFVPAGKAPRPDPYDAPLGEPILAASHRLTARLAHSADATLVLTWADSASAPPAVALAPRPLGEPAFTWEPEIAAAGSTRIDLPHDRFGFNWLSVSGDDAVLTGAWIERQVRPRDIVLIVIDTLRPDYLGCYGGEIAATPAIDGLAAEGILFENALSHAPMTAPSHASLFTSRLPSVHGVTNNGSRTLPRKVPVLAEILAECGYQTAAAVSIGPIRHEWGFDRGFDVYDDRMKDAWLVPSEVVFPRVDELLDDLDRPGFLWAHFSDPHEPYDAHGLVERAVRVVVAGRDVTEIPSSTYTPTTLPLDVPAGDTRVSISSEDEFLLRNVSLRATDGREVRFEPVHGFETPVRLWEGVIGSTAPGPVELVIHLNDRVGSAELIRERYAREVAHSDRFVGMVLDSLRAAGRYDDSLVILTGDHGEALGSHGYIGHVETLYDAMVRVPLIIKPPRGDAFQPGARRSDQAALSDVYTTILARLDLPASPDASGRDLLAPGAEQAETAIFLETHRPEAKRDLYGLRTDHAKIIFEPETESWEFYDLAADPRELDNLAGEESPEFARHRELLTAILQTLQVTEGQGGDIAVDQQTAEMLRSLGY